MVLSVYEIDNTMQIVLQGRIMFSIFIQNIFHLNKNDDGLCGLQKVFYYTNNKSCSLLIKEKHATQNRQHES